MRHLLILLTTTSFLFCSCQKQEKIYYTLPKETKTLHLLFAGDAMMHITQLGKAKTADGYCFDSYFSAVQPLVSSADIAFVNLETTLAASNYTGYPLFASPDSYAIALKEAGFDVFQTANNHCLDRGKRGLERTIDVLGSLEVMRVGTYKNEEDRAANYPLMIHKNDIRIAVLNYTYGMNGLTVKAPNVVNRIDTVAMARDIEACKQREAHFIIATMHWGDEYATRPNREQQRLANFLFSRGVDLVVGAHPHVVQPLVRQEKDGQVTHAVAYSLGNFISNMDRKLTDGGMMLSVSISREPDAEKAMIGEVDYTLLYVHKSRSKYVSGYQLLPITQGITLRDSLFQGEDYAYERMLQFNKLAESVINQP